MRAYLVTLSAVVNQDVAFVERLDAPERFQDLRLRHLVRIRELDTPPILGHDFARCARSVVFNLDFHCFGFFFLFFLLQYQYPKHGLVKSLQNLQSHLS